MTGRIFLVVALAVGFAPPVAAGPTKSAKDCNKELDQQRDKLEAAGDTPQAFFHRCWWESKPGQPTPLKSAKAAAAPKAEASRARPPSDRPRAAKIARGTRAASAERRYAPWRPELIPPPPYEPPPDPGLYGPPPLLVAERPPPPMFRPRVCVFLAPLTGGILPGGPCLPLP